MDAGVVLVGRDRELALLAAALDRVAGGRGCVATISGEAGIGKTALARAVAVAAAARGIRPLWGNCFQGDAQSSFGPWLAALGELGPAPANDHLRPREAGAALRLGAGQPLGNGRRGARGARPRRPPLGHQRQPGALQLRRGARGGVLLLLATYRDPDPAVEGDTPVAAALAVLVRQSNYLHLHLRGLDVDSVSAYLAQAVGDGVPPAVVRAVSERTGGNPFYVREVAKVLVDEGRLVLRDGRWLSDFSMAELAIPRTVVQAVRGRVAGLPEDARQLLRAASAFTGDLALDTVAAVARMGEEATLDALDVALATGLLRRTGRPDAPYAFAHAIVRDTLAGSLTPRPGGAAAPASCRGARAPASGGPRRHR